MTKKKTVNKIKKKCCLCEGDGCFDECNEGLYLKDGNEFHCVAEGGCTELVPIIIKYCPFCGKRLRRRTNNERAKKINDRV